MTEKCTNEKNTNEKYKNEKYTNGKYTNEKYIYELKIAQNEKQPSKVFLTKRNGKCTQPNKKVVTSDSKCT